MSFGYCLIFLGLLCCTTVVQGSTFSYENATLLQAALLNNYYAPVRPNELIQVTINFGLYHIVTLDNVEQRLSLVGFLVSSWIDARLTWDPASYGNLDETYMNNDLIWVPPLTLANPVDGVKIISDDSDTSSIPIVVKNTGAVIWISPANFEVQCSVDITYYPFDSQVCSIIVSSWMYDETSLEILTSQSEINTELYEENGEWELAKSEVETGSRTLYSHATAQVTFKLYLNRKHSYYILNIILPIVLLTILGCLTFYNPSEAGDRSDFAVTVLLSLTVFMSAVSDRIPTTSINICILSVYLTCVLSITSVEVLACMVLRHFHLCHENGQDLTPRMQKFTRFMARIVSYRHEGRSTADDDEKRLVKTDGQTNTPRPATGQNGGLNQTNRSDTPIAWKKDSSDKSNSDPEYTYLDMARILDVVTYYFFLILTSLLTIVFLAIIVFGDDKHKA